MHDVRIGTGMILVRIYRVREMLTDTEHAVFSVNVVTAAFGPFQWFTDSVFASASCLVELATVWV